MHFNGDKAFLIPQIAKGYLITVFLRGNKVFPKWKMYGFLSRSVIVSVVK